MQSMTLEQLRERCVVDEVTGCWVWKYAFSCGVTKMCVRDADGRRVMTSARAMAWVADGHRVVPGRVFSCVCANVRCIFPGHTKHITRADLGKMMVEQGRNRGPHRSLVNTEVSRRLAKLDLDKVREIRSSTETCSAMARRFGVAVDTVWKARRGLTWRETLAGSSVFSFARGGHGAR